MSGNLTHRLRRRWSKLGGGTKLLLGAAAIITLSIFATASDMKSEEKWRAAAATQQPPADSPIEIAPYTFLKKVRDEQAKTTCYITFHKYAMREASDVRSNCVKDKE